MHAMYRMHLVNYLNAELRRNKIYKSVGWMNKTPSQIQMFLTMRCYSVHIRCVQ